MMTIPLGPLALPASPLLLLAAVAVASVAGRWAGRAGQVRIGGILADMLLAALVFARGAFVVRWFDSYRDAPWTMFDIRDGGFEIAAGVAAALGVALWHAWRRKAVHRPLLVGVAAGMLAWGAGYGALQLSQKPAQAGLPPAALVTLDGAPTQLSALAGSKPMVVNLWASWCPPCRREMPVLAAAQQKETGIRFVFVNQGEDAATVRNYLGGAGLELANVLLDTHKGVGRQVGSLALPTTLFYDARGQLVESHLGPLSAGSLAAKLASLKQPPL